VQLLEPFRKGLRHVFPFFYLSFFRVPEAPIAAMIFSGMVQDSPRGFFGGLGHQKKP